MKRIIYYNGQIITMEEQQPNAEAILIEDGRISEVGTNVDILTFKDADTILINLDNKTVLPGFIDSHSHISSIAFTMLMVNVAPSPFGKCNSIQDLVEVLREAFKEERPQKTEWMIGQGYNNLHFEGGEHPTKYDLNKISTSIPIMVLDISGHCAVCNSPALKEFGYSGERFYVPSGGVVEQVKGDTTGLIKDNALLDTNVIPLPSFDKVVRSFKKAIAQYTSYGITTAQDSKTGIIEYFLLKKLAQMGLFQIDIVSYVSREASDKVLSKFANPLTQYENHYRIGGYKLLLDGSPQTKTAWLSKPYYVVPEGKADNYRGFPLRTDEEVLEACKICIENNWQMNAHCNGDAASEQYIEAYTNALKETKSETKLRPVMVHAQIVRDEQLDRMKEIDMIPTFFLDHVYYGGDYHYESVLGLERANRMSPLKSAMEREMKFTLHQDAPVVPPNVIFSVHNAVNRTTKGGRVLGEEQIIPVEEALKAVTIYAAYQIFEENNKGSIKPGKLADFVILDQNPNLVEKSKIKDIQILETIKEGNSVYKK
ncbi:MAG: amidohydrolase [Lachnotalea sp.]